MLAHSTCSRIPVRGQRADGCRTLVHAPSSRTLLAQTQATRRECNETVAAGVAAVLLQLLQPQQALAITGNPLEFKKELKNRRRKIPVSEYTDGPDGIKYYELAVGSGQEAVLGDRVAVHFDVRFRNITIATSRQGMGVTGGTPLGFDVGQPPGAAGSTLRGIDVGVRGMRVGGLRKLIVPPELAYGNRGYGEIPPGASLNIDLELLSIKTSPYGYRTKLVEG